MKVPCTCVYELKGMLGPSFLFRVYRSDTVNYFLSESSSLPFVDMGLAGLQRRCVGFEDASVRDNLHIHGPCARNYLTQFALDSVHVLQVNVDMTDHCTTDFCI